MNRSAATRRLRPIVLGAAAVAALATAGCGEKSEPAVHPPTIAPVITTPTATAPAGTVTRTETTPSAPVPKTTP